MTNFLLRDSFCEAHDFKCSMISFSQSVMLYDVEEDALGWDVSKLPISNTCLKNKNDTKPSETAATVKSPQTSLQDSKHNFNTTDYFLAH